MKKLLTLLMTAVLLSAGISAAPLSARAAIDKTAYEKIISETTEYLEDGSSVTIIVAEESTALTRASVYSKSGSKHYVYTDKDNNELWRFSVHGTFTVNSGISATCTEDSYDFDIFDDAWHNESASSSHSENQARGDAVFIEKILFITTYTKHCDVILSCDSNGNLS